MLSTSLLQLIHRLATHPSLYTEIQAGDRTAVTRYGITLSDAEWDELRMVLPNHPWPDCSTVGQEDSTWGSGSSLASAVLFESIEEPNMQAGVGNRSSRQLLPDMPDQEQ
ncbi:MAG: hypothetical protein ACLFVO_06635 [Chloroflexaceae bacterium]